MAKTVAAHIGQPQCQPSGIYIQSQPSRGRVVKVLDSGLHGHEFDTHTSHGSILKLLHFHLPRFASVYSAANEYKHSPYARIRHWQWLPRCRSNIGIGNVIVGSFFISTKFNGLIFNMEYAI